MYLIHASVLLSLRSDVEDIQPVPGIPEEGEPSKADSSWQKLQDELTDVDNHEHIPVRVI